MSRTSTIRRAARRGAKTVWYESVWQIIGRAISSALAVVVVAALLGLVVVPRLMGGDSLTVLSGSMEPTFAPGDLVVVKGIDEAEVCSNISVGQIVSYFPKPNDPTLITHRVVGKTIGDFQDDTNCRLIMQGDANSSVDDPVSPQQVRGVFMYGVPNLGWARQWVGQNPQNMLYIAAAVLVLWMIVGAVRKPKQRIISIPGNNPSQQPSDTSTAVGSPRIAYPLIADADRDLKERELSLREREIALKEREFEHQVKQHLAQINLDPRDAAAKQEPSSSAPTRIHHRIEA